MIVSNKSIHQILRFCFGGVVAVFCALSETGAADRGLGVSEATNRIFVVLAGVENKLQGEHQTGARERLVYKVFTSGANKVLVSCPTDRRFRCVLDLRDAENKRVAKTREGKGYGASFFELKEFRDGRMATMIALPASPDEVNQDLLSGGFILPGVSDLFNIEKPGKYTLRAEFQVFLRASGKPLTLTRFSAVSLNIVQK